MPRLTIFIFLFLPCLLQAQVQHFPYIENFDSVVVPYLPSGWTTTYRSQSGDFTTTTSAPHSDSNVVISINSTISQSLISPVLDFSNKEADSVKFYERRSGSHNSGVLIEASTDGGLTFTITLDDTLKYLGTPSYVLRKLKLAATLSNQSSAKIRWRVIGNGTGTSGTIRFDDITITALYHTDAAITTIQFQPIYPIIGDSVKVLATIKNAGLQPIQNIPVEFYSDANNNSQPEPDELFGSALINQTLQSGDTIQVQSLLKKVIFGDNTIIVKNSLTGDQNTFNDIKRTSLHVGYPKNSVVINEIMYAPRDPEPEWIEFFNPSIYTVDMKQWKISNRNTSVKYSFLSTPAPLKPHEYCIITKDIALFTAVHPDIPAQIIQASSLPAYCFNNGGDAVVLFDDRGAVVDSMKYFPTWGGTNGTSLERIEYRGGSNDSTNWASSSDSSGCTPGRQNYVTPLEHDLCVLRVSAESSTSNLTNISVVIRNVGHQPAGNFSVSLFVDTNLDTIPQPSELIGTKSSTSTVASKDSVIFDFIWNNPASGQMLLIARIDYAEDMRISDNTFNTVVKISFPSNSLIVNEIMYDPMEGQSEYVELYNRSNVSINICGWKISDYRDTSTKSTSHIITSSSLLLGENDFIIVATDSSIFKRYPYLTDSSFHVVVKRSAFSLNNDGDNIILCDLTGQTIDSVHYLPSWHNAELEEVAGRSLERINPNLPGNDRRNWSTSASPDGGTPGKQNSIFTASVPNSTTVSFSPNPFSPDGDGFEDVTIMSYLLPTTTALIRVRIYDAKGRLVRTLANGEPSGAHGEIIWNGFNDDNQKVAMGIYIVLLEALDANGGSVQTTKRIVVVAAKM